MRGGGGGRAGALRDDCGDRWLLIRSWLGCMSQWFWLFLNMQACTSYRDDLEFKLVITGKAIMVLYVVHFFLLPWMDNKIQDDLTRVRDIFQQNMSNMCTYFWHFRHRKNMKKERLKRGEKLAAKVLNRIFINNY